MKRFMKQNLYMRGRENTRLTRPQTSEFILSVKKLMKLKILPLKNQYLNPVINTQIVTIYKNNNFLFVH